MVPVTGYIPTRQRSGGRDSPERPDSSHNAGGGTRTPTGISPPAPKAGASTNCATPALVLILRRAQPPNPTKRSKAPGEIVWSADVPPVRNLRPGYTVAYPNRDKASSKTTKSIVILLLLVS